MNAEKIIKKARTQLVIKEPFFGYLANSLSLEEDDLLFPVGTDGQSIYYDEELIEELEITVREMEGTLVHELMHLILKHTERRRTRFKMKWNIATDLVINSMVTDLGFELPDGTLTEEEYSEESAEEVYDELPDFGKTECPECGGRDIRKKELKVKGKNEESSKVLKAEAEFKCRKCGNEWKDEVDVILSGSSGDGEKWEDVEIPSLDDHDLWEQVEMEENEWRRKVAEASNKAEMHGDMPSGLKRMVKDLVHPRIDWRRLLERYIRTQDREEYTWKRPNRRYVSNDMYYPSLKSTKLEVAIAIDTSGSVDEGELKKFMSEITGILCSVKNFRAHLMACDAEVHAHETALSKRDFEQFMEVCEGGGGTDFRPVFEELEDVYPDCLVYLTDGRGTYPQSKPMYDVIWALNKKVPVQYEPPFGRKVVIDGGA